MELRIVCEEDYVRFCLNDADGWTTCRAKQSLCVARNKKVEVAGRPVE